MMLSIKERLKSTSPLQTHIKEQNEVWFLPPNAPLWWDWDLEEKTFEHLYQSTFQLQLADCGLGFRRWGLCQGMKCHAPIVHVLLLSVSHLQFLGKLDGHHLLPREPATKSLSATDAFMEVALAKRSYPNFSAKDKRT